MGCFKPTARALITGKDRGRYMDFRPYCHSGYFQPGELNDRKNSQYRSSGHLLDVNAYGNSMDNGHFYARYRIWGCQQGKSAHSFAPRLSWKFIVNVLASSPDGRTLQWEMRKQKDLLLQSVHSASLSEIAGLLRCYAKHSERIASEDLSVRIQQRINSMYTEMLMASPESLQSIRQHGFSVPQIDEPTKTHTFRESLTKIRKMLSQRGDIVARQHVLTSSE
ncbi:N-alpha-acetyltransferase 15 NatA auxiliary subunit-like protein [Perkinsela sp. CCAP 1560/4]|nr:N-alpha-acetyltransferase 15 NatA auxiliary subunit-like protein [Perkinsela sp. CCAP 1560/4]|eukprot:KNH08055.1 N-alpha-acetyltransferase 15 NatA auxiliary subunit-like protein [Perkinsela sp. CCAP 1560/4]